MSTVGENIDEVERLTAEQVGTKYAVALSCGTAAMHLAVKLAGVKPGDRVFCSDLTFNATVNLVVYEGGVPVFIDSEMETCKESNVPIIVTKNGYGEMVLMSIPLYEKTMAEAQAANLVNEALDEIDSGAEPMEGKEFFSSMREKYEQ